MAQQIIAVIGAGGKTTALGLLARQSGHRSVLVTTTTHIFPMSAPECWVCLRDPTPEALTAALAQPGIVCAGSAARQGKLGILPEETLASGIAAASLVVYEGDGAHFHPLKLHRPEEPVLLPETQRCLVVAGLSGLGKPVSEAVHRHSRNPQWQAEPARPVGSEELMHCIWETIEASRLPLSQIRVLLNQEDTLADPRPAREAAARLQAQGLNARSGSLKNAPAFLYKWVAE